MAEDARVFDMVKKLALMFVNTKAVCEQVKRKMLTIYQLLQMVRSCGGESQKMFTLLVGVFRNTELWEEFLVELIHLPQECWQNDIFNLEESAQLFSGADIIILLHLQAHTPRNRISPIFSDLHWDRYWKESIRILVSDNRLELAQKRLTMAHNGLASIGPMSKASNKCLSKLAVQLNEARERCKFAKNIK